MEKFRGAIIAFLISGISFAPANAFALSREESNKEWQELGKTVALYLATMGLAIHGHVQVRKGEDLIKQNTVGIDARAGEFPPPQLQGLNAEARGSSQSVRIKFYDPHNVSLLNERNRHNYLAKKYYKAAANVNPIKRLYSKKARLVAEGHRLQGDLAKNSALRVPEPVLTTNTFSLSLGQSIESELAKVSTRNPGLLFHQITFLPMNSLTVARKLLKKGGNSIEVALLGMIPVAIQTIQTAYQVHLEDDHAPRSVPARAIASASTPRKPSPAPVATCPITQKTEDTDEGR